MRYLLRQGDTAGAKQQLERLAKLSAGIARAESLA